MAEVILIDTCILLNVLDIPGFNQDRAAVFDELTLLTQADGITLLLPFAAIIETGNHIAHVADGQLRRQASERFCREVGSAIDGQAPWRPARAFDLDELRLWLPEVPDYAMREVGLGDLSIVKEWEETCGLHPTLRVRIWSLDGGLQGYDRIP